MKTFAELCNYKPSVPLQAMRDGLLKYDQDPNFQIDMSTYGEAEEGVCFGCAATCTVMHLTGVRFTPGSIEQRLHAEFLNVEQNDLQTFENAIDDARCGDMYALFNYLGQSDRLHSDWNHRFGLSSSNWREQISSVEGLIQELEAAGL